MDYIFLIYFRSIENAIENEDVVNEKVNIGSGNGLVL